MERSMELNQFLQGRLSAAETVIFQNTPTNSLADASAVNPGLEPTDPPATNKSEGLLEPIAPPAATESEGLVAFWQRQISDTTITPQPVQTGMGISGLGSSTAAVYAAAKGKSSNISFPLTPSTALTYHGRGIDYDAKHHPNRPRSGSVTADGHIHKTGKSGSQSQLLGEEEAPIDAQWEAHGTKQGDGGNDESQSQLTLYGAPKEATDVGCASEAVLALLRAADFCLSVSSTSRKSMSLEQYGGAPDFPIASSSEQQRGPTSSSRSNSAFGVPHRALLKLLNQFAGIRSKGLLDLADVVDSFRICERTLKQQRRYILRGRMGVGQSALELLARRGSGSVSDAKSPSARIAGLDTGGQKRLQGGVASRDEGDDIATLLANSNNRFEDDIRVTISQKTIDQLMDTLRKESDALRDKYNIGCQGGAGSQREPLLMLCDNLDEAMPPGVTPSSTVAQPPKPAFPSTCEIPDGECLSTPMIPRASLWMAPITSVTNPEAIKAMDAALEVVNVVPLPEALKGSADHADEDGPEDQEGDEGHQDRVEDADVLDIAMFSAFVDSNSPEKESNTLEGKEAVAGPERDPLGGIACSLSKGNRDSGKDSDGGVDQDTSHVNNTNTETANSIGLTGVQDEKIDTNKADSTVTAARDDSDVEIHQTTEDKMPSEQLENVGDMSENRAVLKKVESPSTASTRECDGMGDPHGLPRNKNNTTGQTSHVAFQPNVKRVPRRKRSWFSPSCLRPPATLD